MIYSKKKIYLIRELHKLSGLSRKERKDLMKNFEEKKLLDDQRSN